MVTVRNSRQSFSPTQIDSMASRASSLARAETENAIFKEASSSADGNSPWNPAVVKAAAEQAGQLAGQAAESAIREEVQGGGFATVETLSNFALMVPIVATCTLILDQLITYQRISSTWIAVAVSAFASTLLAISTWSEMPKDQQTVVKRGLTWALVVFNTLILAATALGIGEFVGANK